MIKEFFLYLWHRKRWWMIPPLIILVLVGVLIALSATTPMSPFVYTLF